MFGLMQFGKKTVAMEDDHTLEEVYLVYNDIDVDID
jgi:hypothetical protein